jgi:Fe-S-cluster containining protein
MADVIAQSPDNENAGAPPCLGCGTCCFGDGPLYLRISGDDHARLGDDADHLVFFDGNRAYMRMAEAGHCAALSIDAAQHMFSCSIYERRPTTCRTLERGSAACEAERERKGARPGDLVQLRLSQR